MLNQTNKYERFKPLLTTIRFEDLPRIANMARAMTFNEILDNLLIDESELTAEEKTVVERIIRYGRAGGIKEATDNLFLNMRESKNGAQACLSYLKRHATQFIGEMDDTEGSSNGFSYKVNISVNEDKGNKIQENKEGKVVELKRV